MPHVRHAKWDDADQVCKIALLAEGIALTRLPLETVRKEIEKDPRGVWVPWMAADASLAAYRAGDHAEAIRLCNLSLDRERGEPGNLPEAQSADGALRVGLRADNAGLLRHFLGA